MNTLSTSFVRSLVVTPSHGKAHRHGRSTDKKKPNNNSLRCPSAFKKSLLFLEWKWKICLRAVETENNDLLLLAMKVNRTLERWRCAALWRIAGKWTWKELNGSTRPPDQLTTVLWDDIRASTYFGGTSLQRNSRDGLNPYVRTVACCNPFR